MTISYKLYKSAIADETPKLTTILLTRNGVVTSIPLDPDNRDYAEYLEWVAAGNTAEAAD